mgnify:CR=1 FL=1
MNITSKKVNDVLVIVVQGEIMGGTDAESFKNAIYKSIEDDVTNIVVDLKKATWMNSSGLGMLITGLTTVRSSGGDLFLAQVSERIRRPLEVTKLDSVFSIYDTVDEAIAGF